MMTPDSPNDMVPDAPAQNPQFARSQEIQAQLKAQMLQLLEKGGRCRVSLMKAVINHDDGNRRAALDELVREKAVIVRDRSPRAPRFELPWKNYNC